MLVAGFSKAYSSLLAFLALPTRLKDALKVLAPPYLYSGPSPVASLATTLAGLEVNRTRGDLDPPRPVARRRTASSTRWMPWSIYTPERSPGYPIIEIPLADHDEIDDVGRYLFDHGIYATMAAYPLVPKDEVGFRIQVTAANTDEEIDHLIDVLTSVRERFRLRARDLRIYGSRPVAREHVGAAVHNPSSSPPPMPMGFAVRGRLWILYVVAALAATAGYYALGQAVAIFHLIAVRPPWRSWSACDLPARHKLPWILFALGQIFFIAGDVISYNYEKFFGTRAAVPGRTATRCIWPSTRASSRVILLIVRRRSAGRDRGGLIDAADGRDRHRRRCRGCS